MFSSRRPSSLDGHSNSAGLSSIIGSDSFAALFSVGENFSFLTRLFVVKFGFVVLVSVHWITLTCLSYCPSVTSPSKFLLGVLKSDGFAALAVAMMLMLAIFVCFQFCGYGGGRSPVSVIKRLCPAGCDAGTSSYLVSSPTPACSVLVSRDSGSWCWNNGDCFAHHS